MVGEAELLKQRFGIGMRFFNVGGRWVEFHPHHSLDPHNFGELGRIKGSERDTRWMTPVQIQRFRGERNAPASQHLDIGNPVSGDAIRLQLR
jgi:hypothetical protein